LKFRTYNLEGLYASRCASNLESLMQVDGDGLMYVYL